MSKRSSTVDLRELEVIHEISRGRTCPRIEGDGEVKARLGEGECIAGNPHPDCRESRFRVCKLLCEHFRHDLSTVCMLLEKRRKDSIEALIQLLKEGRLTREEYNAAFEWFKDLDLNCKFHGTTGRVGQRQMMVWVKEKTE